MENLGIKWDRLIEVVGYIYQNPKMWDQDIPWQFKYIDGYKVYCPTCIIGTAKRYHRGMEYSGSFDTANGYLGLNRREFHYLYGLKQDINLLVELVTTKKFPWE